MKELLQEQTTADPVDNSDLKNGATTSTPNWEREQLQNTPFWIVGNNEQGYNIIMGKWKITQEPIFPNPEALNHIESIIYEAERWLYNNQWNVTLSMIICAITDTNNQKQN